MSPDTPTIADDAVDAAADAIRTTEWDGSYWDQARAALDAALPVLRRQWLEWAADEVHREARWQKESQMRGMFANGETSVDRLLMLERIIREVSSE